MINWDLDQFYKEKHVLTLYLGAKTAVSLELLNSKHINDFVFTFKFSAYVIHVSCCSTGWGFAS